MILINEMTSYKKEIAFFVVIKKRIVYLFEFLII